MQNIVSSCSYDTNSLSLSLTVGLSTYDKLYGTMSDRQREKERERTTRQLAEMMCYGNGRVNTYTNDGHTPQLTV